MDAMFKLNTANLEEVKLLFKQSRLEYIYSKTANTYKTQTKP